MNVAYEDFTESQQYSNLNDMKDMQFETDQFFNQITKSITFNDNRIEEINYHEYVITL